MMEQSSRGSFGSSDFGCASGRASGARTTEEEEAQSRATEEQTEAAQSPMSVKASPAISVSEKTVAKFRAAAVAAAPATPTGDAAEEEGDSATSKATAA